MLLILLVMLQYNSCALRDNVFLDEKWESGTEVVDSGADMFYWLFKARKPTTTPPPLIIWLQGGPGISSLFGLFGVNGPYTFDFTKPDAILKKREYAINNKYDAMYVDQPISVGFSLANDTSKVCSTNQCAAQHFAIFLNKFFMKHEEYRRRDLYIFGESYAGSYIPVLAEYIYKEQNPYINLKGVAIGDGKTDPSTQITSLPYYAIENKMINQFEFISSVICIGIVRLLMILKFKEQANYFLQDGAGYCYNVILGSTSRKYNPYNIHNPSYPGYTAKETLFLGKEEVKKALGVSGRTWNLGSSYVDKNYVTGDLLNSMAPSLRFLMERIKVLLYIGTLDFQCNYIGVEQYINHMDWSGQTEFNKLSYSDYKLPNGTVVGSIKKKDNFVFLKVNDAGHYVPRDQPEVASQILDDFIGAHFE
jgi:cathepsin A (carboxypeptidase C)